MGKAKAGRLLKGVEHKSVVYHVGDDVSLQNPEGGLPFVGTIKQIKQRKGGGDQPVTLAVQWFYRPAEIPRKLLQQHRISLKENELMESSHTDDNSPKSIVGKINIYRVKTIPAKYKVGGTFCFRVRLPLTDELTFPSLFSLLSDFGRLWKEITSFVTSTTR